MKSKCMLSSLSFPSFLSIVVIVIVTVLIGWSSIVIFSEGQKEIPGIKITSPTNGQNISTGSNLTISGSATGTNITSTNTTSTNTGNNMDHNRCYVSVIVNNIRPYQNATAGGSKGVNDYSKWYYTLSTKFGAIKEGQNKLTGRLSCFQASSINSNSANVINTTNNLIKWSSVNVTGVSTPTSSTVNRNNQTITNSTIDPSQQPQSKTGGNITMTPNSTTITPAPHTNMTSNSTSQSVKKENTTSGGGLSAKLTQTPPTSKSTSKYNYDNSNPKRLSISIQSSQDIVNGRGTSTITAIAYDANTGKKISNAIVKLKIVFTSNGTTKEIVGHSGEITYSAEIKPNSKNSSNINFKTTVQASAPGYISTSKTSSSSSLSSTSTSTSASTMASKSNQSTIDSGSDNLTQSILKNVQRQLKQNGIDVALGK